MIPTLTEHKQLYIMLTRPGAQERRCFEGSFRHEEPSSESKEDCGVETKTGDAQTE